ncbi:MAG: hypothetical protein GWO23_21845, partial [Gammaproteobacteria bacterium]|nr:hypothetical protein [Gammaproteobacteria bacterium]NIW50410.1 hypothetical protein [Gammaproteobacteria bacterium]
MTKTQHATLRALLRKMEGTWSGKFIENICRGSERNPRVEQREYRVNAMTQISAEPALLLLADLNSAESSKRINFKLYLREKELRYITDSPGNRVQV